jgi:hypothetical protein
MPPQAFGEHKQSGIGCENSLDGPAAEAGFSF